MTLFGVVDAGVSRYTTTSSAYNIHPLVVRDDAGQIVANPLARAATPALFGARQSQTAMSNSGLTGSRLGFRGTEDLGGGLAASFWLEAPISNDDGKTGPATFGRRSTVSLSGAFGEVRLGRDNTPTFWNDTVFDPFGTNGVGTNVISTVNSNLAANRGNGLNTGLSGNTDNYIRSSNSIGYFLPPNLGGFYGQVMYTLHENVSASAGYMPDGRMTDASPSTRGRYIGGRFGYANGPLDVAVAYGQSTVLDSTQEQQWTVLEPPATTRIRTAGGESEKLNSFNIGASYDFGVVKLFGELSQVKDQYRDTFSGSGVRTFANSPLVLTGMGGYVDRRVDKYNGYLIGLTAPVGAGVIRAAYSRVKLSSGIQPGNFIGYVLAPNRNDLLISGSNGDSDASANKIALGYVHNLSKRTALYATASRVRIKSGWNNGAIMGTTVGGQTAYLNTGSLAGYAPRSATGYDFGIRHSF